MTLQIHISFIDSLFLQVSFQYPPHIRLELQRVPSPIVAFRPTFPPFYFFFSFLLRARHISSPQFSLLKSTNYEFQFFFQWLDSPLGA